MLSYKPKYTPANDIISKKSAPIKPYNLIFHQQLLDLFTLLSYGETLGM